MIVRCLGWTEPRHAPLTLAVVEPFDSDDVSDGMCPPCAAAVNAQIDATEKKPDEQTRSAAPAAPLR